MIVIGNYIENLKCESFMDPETCRLRVRPLGEQGVPTNLLIECSSVERDAYPVGTVFITENVKVCKKKNGRVYLRAKDHKITKI